MSVRQSGQATPISVAQFRRLVAVVAAFAAGLLAATSVRAREVVAFDAGVSPGTVVIRASERALYLVGEGGTAIRYRVAVGMPGKQWFGWSAIDGKHVEPAWMPPPEVKRDNPRLPNLIAGGAPGNPMGPRALTLVGGEYAIHGTNRPGSVGTFASYGCIRMYNHDIVDLFERVRVGTRVVMVR